MEDVIRTGKDPARRRPPGARRTAQNPENRRVVAVG
jgi:hypothetical protein